MRGVVAIAFALAACGDDGGGARLSATDVGSSGGADTTGADTEMGSDEASSSSESQGTGSEGSGSEEGSGSTTGGPEPSSTVPGIDPEDPHRFVRGDDPWYPAGYYPGAALNMTGPGYAGDFEGYNHALIDLLADHGIDLFRVWVNWGNLGEGSTWDAFIQHPYLRPGPGMAADGGLRLDLDQFDPVYFDLVEDAVAYAQERGIVVQVMALDCWHAGFGLSSGFGALDYFAAANNINGVDFSTHDEWIDVDGEPFARSRAFVEHLVDQLGAYPNIIWETCNEKMAGDHSTPTATAMDPFHAGIAEAIHGREDANGYPRHLVMPVDLPEHRTVAGHRTPTNGGPSEESIPAMHDRLAGEQWQWAVPLVSDNDCCAGEPAADFVRNKAWAALTAGAHVDVFNNELFIPAVMGNQNTADGMEYVGLVGRFVRDLDVDLRGMVPADDAVDAGAWAFGRAGEAYVVYLSAGGTVTLLDPPPDPTATWFDPRTGDTMPADGGPAYTAPTAADWVLYVAGS